MKPTKMRNAMIYRATNHTRSKQLSSPLSKDLQKKYGKRSARLVEGDNVKVMRGEFFGVDGKVSSVSVLNGSIAIEGVKKEKSKGEKIDVMIHSSNVVITSLNTDDDWRMSRLEGKNPKTSERIKRDDPSDVISDPSTDPSISTTENIDDLDADDTTKSKLDDLYKGVRIATEPDDLSSDTDTKQRDADKLEDSSNSDDQSDTEIESKVETDDTLIDTDDTSKDDTSNNTEISTSDKLSSTTNDTDTSDTTNNANDTSTSTFDNPNTKNNTETGSIER